MEQIKEISAKYLFEESQKQLFVYDKKEQESILYILFEDVFNISKISILSGKIIPWQEEHQAFLDTCIQRLNLNEPIQYIVGFTTFYSLRFHVSKDVLIPRPETEELVDLILKTAQKTKNRILDIGTGSGCIAISLASNLPEARVTAIDISKRALVMAQKNADENSVHVQFKEIDFLTEAEKIEETFNIIVSNPPYVLHSEKEQMNENVLQYEPHLALFVEDHNALIYYEALFKFAAVHLESEGTVFAEINEQKGHELLLLAGQYGLQHSGIIKDLYGKDRILIAKK